jgi:hypothetical protein
MCVLALAHPAGSAAARAQDYTFDTSGLDKRAYDLSSSVELWPTFLILNESSPLYALMYGTEGPSYSNIYRLRAEAGGQYQYRSVLASVSGSLNAVYQHLDDSVATDAKLYEGYLKYAPSTSFSLLAGKKTFLWGKGYAYNPVAFAGRPRDLNDINAALEGYWSLAAEWIRSSSGRLSTLAVTGAVLPVYGSVNKGFLRDSSVAGVAQIYLLLLDTDVDGCLYADSRNGFRAGVDFAKNIRSSWEIHGEWAHVSDVRATFFADDSTLASEARSADNFVLGTRYLAPTNTTFILEYLHQGTGLTSERMSAYYRVLDSPRASEDPGASGEILRNSAEYYSGQFVMTDYLFLKISHPDPFMLVYLTPSAYTIVNLVDGSLMAGFEATYSRLSHLLLTVRCVAFAGPDESEYGIRPAQQRFELRAKWSF